MSAKTVRGAALPARSISTTSADRPVSTSETWVRNPSWLSLSAVDSTDQRLRGVVAVRPEGTYLALSASGNYTIDWGDGTSENVSSGVVATKLYDYNDADLANTNAPVTLTDTGDLIERNSHGYTNGAQVRFYNIVSTSDIVEGQIYYVVNATTNNFQIAASVGGSPLTLTTSGSATLLPYKQAIVNVTPQSGQNLTALNLHVRHTATNLPARTEASWLDLEISLPYLTGSDLVMGGVPVTFTDAGDLVARTSHGYNNGTALMVTNSYGVAGPNFTSTYYVVNATTDTFQLSTTLGGAALAVTGDGPGAVLLVSFNSCERVALRNLGAATSIAHLFSNFASLQKIVFPETLSTITDAKYLFAFCTLTEVPFFDTSSVVTAKGMFVGCRSLITIPLIDLGSATDTSYMFYNCVRLQHLPRLDLSASTNMSYMFYLCRALNVLPFLNTAACTNMSNTFVQCTFTEIQLLNTSLVTNFSNTFQECRSLRTVPLLDTSSATTTTSMFSGCASLEAVPKFNTSAVTTASSMFNGCLALKEIPLFDTSSLITANAMFQTCVKVREVPLLNTSSVSNMALMFSNCLSLTTMPLLDTSSATTTASMFDGCSSLVSIPQFNTASSTSFSSMFSGCDSLKYVPQLNTAAATNLANMFEGCDSLESVPLFNTAAVTSFSSMFSGCTSLTSVPALNTSAVTTSAGFLGMFAGCPSLASIKAKEFKQNFSVASCRLGKTQLEEIFANLPTPAATRTLTITGNTGIGTSVTSRSTTRTAQSATATLTDTSSLAIGMLATGTGTGISTGVTVTSDVTANTLTLNNHGLANGTTVAFSSLGTTTGVTTWTIYYVVNATTNTLQISATLGGAALDLTGTNGSMILRYPSYITGIITNTSITLSAPMATTGTGNLDYRSLDAAGAMLKNWTLTY